MIVIILQVLWCLEWLLDGAYIDISWIRPMVFNGAEMADWHFKTQFEGSLVRDKKKSTKIRKDAI